LSLRRGISLYYVWGTLSARYEGVTDVWNSVAEIRHGVVFRFGFGEVNSY